MRTRLALLLTLGLGGCAIGPDAATLPVYLFAFGFLFLAAYRSATGRRVFN